MTLLLLFDDDIEIILLTWRGLVETKDRVVVEDANDDGDDDWNHALLCRRLAKDAKQAAASITVFLLEHIVMMVDKSNKIVQRVRLVIMIQSRGQHNKVVCPSRNQVTFHLPCATRLVGVDLVGMGGQTSSSLPILYVKSGKTCEYIHRFKKEFQLVTDNILDQSTCL